MVALLVAAVRDLAEADQMRPMQPQELSASAIRYIDIEEVTAKVRTYPLALDGPI